MNLYVQSMGINQLARSFETACRLRTYMQPTFELPSHINETRIRDIDSQDLWHLFRHGEIIISTEPSENRQTF